MRATREIYWNIIADLTFNDILDVDSCTGCSRSLDRCPSRIRIDQVAEAPTVASSCRYRLPMFEAAIQIEWPERLIAVKELANWVTA